MSATGSENPYKTAEAVVEEAIGGDLVEFHRTIAKLPYEHFAVYIGDSNTIGVGIPDKQTKRSQIEKKTVSDLCSKKCRVNNLEKYAKKKGLTAIVPSEDIVKRAITCFERNIVYTYSLRFGNCEHFATLCRYGHQFSIQTERFGFKPHLIQGSANLQKDSDRLDSATGDASNPFAAQIFSFLHRAN